MALILVCSHEFQRCVEYMIDRQRPRHSLLLSGDLHYGVGDRHRRAGVGDHLVSDGGHRDRRKESPDGRQPCLADAP